MQKHIDGEVSGENSETQKVDQTEVVKIRVDRVPEFIPPRRI